MNVVLDFKELVRQYVAPHRRQPVRLRWLWGLTDLEGAWEQFAAWRDYYRYKVRVTGQQASVEGHLGRLLGSGVKVVVRSYADGYLSVGLEQEVPHWVEFDPQKEIALEGEIEELFGGCDFVVYVPHGTDMMLVTEEVERYRLADKKYKLIET